MTRPRVLPRRRAVILPVLGGLSAAVLGLSACGGSAGAETPPRAATSPPQTAGTAAAGGDSATGASASPGTVRDVATGLNVPWGVAFLPGGDALVAERETGRILRVPAAGGARSQVIKLDGVDTESGEGGLLGVAVSPGFAGDRYVYAYYTSADDNRIVRFRLGETRTQTILSGLNRNSFHNGGRIAFGPDGRLYVGTGDAGNRQDAQNRAVRNGKILRLMPDGTVPADNPFPGSPVYSLGHRNVQGLAWDRDRRLWAVEFGQNTFDEVNLIEPGRNYGWPVVEGKGDTHGGMYTNPLVTWTTDEASPSGAAIVGDNLYVAALRGERLWRVPLSGRTAGTPQALLTGRYGRLRTAVAAPDGTLWVTTSNRDSRGDPRDGDDRILSLTV